VEVGGTFTDLVSLDENGVHVTKVPSTPAAPEQGALAALEAAGLRLDAVRDLVHGSTVATNAILERKGARICLLVTAGTRDLLYLQRHDRRRIYDLYYRKPEPVAARRDTFEIEERIDAEGRVVTTLDPARARETVRRALAEADFEAIAICLLNSYVNPGHERALARLVRAVQAERGEGAGSSLATVTCSHEACREFREYERCSTTALSAYVQPVIDGYLGRFRAALEARGYQGRFSVMQSNGGRLPAEAMGRNAITSLFSGPAAGVTGALRQAARSGFRDLITLDMGGTSTDVCLVEDGEPLVVGSTEIDGLPVKTPVIDIATVGAGGGSLVWIDDGGLLRVGPRSAGADPGPACYRRGGSRPTVTDAHLVRATIRPETFLGGRMWIDVDAARQAFAPIAGALGLGLEEAADSAVRIAESNIVRAVQRTSTERGRDPRDYTLVAFGGAGPMQCARVAEELGIRTVLVPPHAGVVSAFGLVACDFVHYTTRTHRLRVSEENLQELSETVEALEREARAYLVGLGLAGAPRMSVVLEMRYVTQAFEIPVHVEPGELAGLGAGRLVARFDAAHRQAFEFDAGASTPVEVVSIRVGASVPPEHAPRLAEGGEPTGRIPAALYEHGQRRTGLRSSRGDLAGSGPLPGPALVQDQTSTLYIPPGWTGRLDEAQNVLLERSSNLEERT